MRRLVFTAIALFLGIIGSTAQTTIDPALREEMGKRGDDEKIKIVVLMNEQSDAKALSREANFFATKQERRAFVVETLKRQAETSHARPA